MTLRERLFARFHAVATGTLRLDPESADAFASHIAHANEGLHVVGQLCTGANALRSETLAVMLERWFRLLPEYDAPRRTLALRKGPMASVTPISAGTALLLHARVFDVCLSQRGLPESQALQVAVHVREAASAFWALQQRSFAPEHHAQKVLCSTLRAALDQPLSHAREAASVFLEAGERPPIGPAAP